MSKKGISVTILSKSSVHASKTTQWGLGQDARIIEQVIKESSIHGNIRIGNIQHYDPMAFYCGKQKPSFADIQIHLEIPCRAAWKWGRINIVVVNQEWWHRRIGIGYFIQKKVLLYLYSNP